MPSIKKTTEYRRDNDEDEERLRLDWGDGGEDEDKDVYKGGKLLTKKEAKK